jgi:hypothetical protein
MVENNPHIETTMDNYELLYDLETWLLDLLHHALTKINARFVQFTQEWQTFMIHFLFYFFCEATWSKYLYCEVERGFPLHASYFSLN